MLVLEDSPQLALTTQQTPKPEAHEPLETPEAVEHSSTVRQVPLRPLVAVHGWLGKVTTLKMPRPAWGAPRGI